LNWILKEDANTAIGILGSTSYKGAR